MFTLGESLGGVGSLIEHARLMHASAAGSALEVPVGPGAKFFVGIENVDDLLDDLQQALGK
ncbi:Cystathionine gamma-synthase OS=Streptomyces griseomycini OX=66895 GN=FHS37_001340 PE=3 SV=1 [Streptomyces griseomycini]